MKKVMAIVAWSILIPTLALAQDGYHSPRGLADVPVSAATHERTEASGKYYGDAYTFFGRRNAKAGANVGGAGADLFIYKGIAVGGDVGTTVGDPDNRITIGSVGSSYHFLCCRNDRKVEPIVGAGYSWLRGNINTHGYIFPFDPGQNRAGPYFNQGLAIWPTSHFGVRLEIREYGMSVSYGALEDVIPGGKVVEFRVGVTVR